MPGGLLTGLYELNMAASYLPRAMTGLATFSLFVRRLPAGRGFLVAAGLEDCLQFLENFTFTADDLDYLRRTQGYGDDTLRWLPPSARALRDPTPVPVHVSEQLQCLQDQLMHDLMLYCPASWLFGTSGERPAWASNFRSGDLTSGRPVVPARAEPAVQLMPSAAVYLCAISPGRLAEPPWLEVKSADFISCPLPQRIRRPPLVAAAAAAGVRSNGAPHGRTCGKQPGRRHVKRGHDEPVTNQ
jgi:Nicotinate phosphoribosyltransferase (NAPRTase) N-terminal domain